jgi:glycosyltransferase involved in cell wall biosynthesis
MIGFEATREVLAHDVLALHLPQLDAAGMALRARLFGRPSVLTYHCDLLLPDGVINSVANQVVNLANRAAGTLVDRVIAYTEDYATHSPYLSRFMQKLEVILPPVEVAPVSGDAVERFIRDHRQTEGPAIGIAVRLATEKGVEYLLGALPEILSRHPEAEVLFAGQHENVLGEEEYARRLAPLFEKYRHNWTFLGVLDPSRMSAFYAACDVTVLPSVNSTESFGLVQIESMICGTPVVASNLPGVRQPVRITGMGELVPLRDSKALAEAILKIFEQPRSYIKDSAQIAGRFSPLRCAQRYESLFQGLLGGDQSKGS